MNVYCIHRICVAASVLLTWALLGHRGVAAAITLPDGTTLEKVDFERHVMGLLGKMGCNSGSCHGAFKGRGGFRLSLFGYDVENDFHTLIEIGSTRPIPKPACFSSSRRKPSATAAANGSRRTPGLIRFCKAGFNRALAGRRGAARLPPSSSTRRNTPLPDLAKPVNSECEPASAAGTKRR